MTKSRFIEELAIQVPKKVFINMILIPRIREVNAALYSDGFVRQ
ncbi:MAG TPA: hypothetical protein VMT01_01250 [Candidatus Acidoferrum sp.]|nr:hypothetical protein [Candidatus Acidoferrum sp.]